MCSVSKITNKVFFLKMRIVAFEHIIMARVWLLCKCHQPYLKKKIFANRSDMGIESHLGLGLFQGINPTFIYNTAI